MLAYDPLKGWRPDALARVKGDDKGAPASTWDTPQEVGEGKTERIERAHRVVDAFAPLSQDKAFSEAIAGPTSSEEKEVTEAKRPKPNPRPRALDVHALPSTKRHVQGGFTDISAFERCTVLHPVALFWRDYSGDGPPHGSSAEDCGRAR